MKELKLVSFEDPILRRVSKPLKTIRDRYKRKIKAMFEIMYQNNGIGLAAPQVGWDAQVFIMNITGNTDDEHVLINPKIIELGKDIVEYPEGCLSFPGIYGPVDRPQSVIVRAQNIDGKEITFSDNGLMSRCMLHEIDHLNGEVFIDKAKKLYKGDDPL